MKKLFSKLTGKHNKMTLQERPLKVAVVGDQGVGKTNLILRYTEDKFTIGTNVHSLQNIHKKVITDEGDCFVLDIRDTKGGESFRLINKIQYRGANIIIILFDTTKRNSFESIKTYWITEIFKEMGETTSGKENFKIFSNCHCRNKN